MVRREIWLMLEQCQTLLSGLQYLLTMTIPHTDIPVLLALKRIVLT